MVMGPVELPGEVVLPLPLPPLPLLLLVPLQAARTLTESTATALMASAFFENQGKAALTPGSSFLVVQDSSGSSPPVTFACSPLRFIPVESAFCSMNASNRYIYSHS